MSVRDLFEKRYADAIENLSDDVLEIFDFLLEKCDEIEYTRDIQRKRICELERENNILKLFLADSESIEENSDEICDILADADALCKRLSLFSELTALADSISTRCNTLRASTDRLQKQREECEQSLGTQVRPEYEEGTYLTDVVAREACAFGDGNVKEAARSASIETDSSMEKKVEPMPKSHDDELSAAESGREGDASELMDPISLFRSQKTSETDRPTVEPKRKPVEKKTSPKNPARKDSSDDISDITSRLRSMLDEGDVKASKKARDDDGYSDLAKLFFTDGK